MSDRGSKAGSFHEEAPTAKAELDVEISLNDDSADELRDSNGQLEIITPPSQTEKSYQNVPHNIPPEPKNVRINLYDRDPTNLNGIVKVQFDDIFAEPEGTHSIDAIWVTSHSVFTTTKHWCYRILSAIFAVPCSFCWGLHFACLAFNYIWTIQPSFRSFQIQLRPLAKIWSLCIRAFCDPLFESIALVLSKIRLTFKKD